jgi:hypothetical protein
VAAGGGLKRFQGPTGFQQLLTHINLISSVNQKSFGNFWSGGESDFAASRSLLQINWFSASFDAGQLG